MPATLADYDRPSTHPGFASEGKRLDHVEALHGEYHQLAGAHDPRADQVAESLIQCGEPDPRKAAKKRS
jgi:hypothetical protein